MLDVLARVAPGTAIREGVDRIIKAGKGAILVIGASEEVLGLVSGGFRLDTKFTAQRLSELAKMDGAIVLDETIENILWANVHLVPDPTIPTSETGTRHRSAQRTAIHTGKAVLSVSESMHVVTLYLGERKHIFDEPSTILFRANQALATLERYKNRLDEVSSALSIVEVEGTVTLRDVVNVLQRGGMVQRIADEIEAYVAELGKDGRLLHLQLEELMAGVTQESTHVVRDYLPDRRRNVETIVEELEELAPQELLDLQRVAETLGFDTDTTSLDDLVSPRGYRMLHRVPRLPESIIDRLVERFGALSKLLAASLEDLDEVEGVGETRARSIRDNLSRMAEVSLMERYT